MQKNILIFGHSYDPVFIDVNNQYTSLFDKKKYSVTVVYLVGKYDKHIEQKHIAENVIFLDTPKSSARGLKLTAIKTMMRLCKEKNFAMAICHRYKPTYVMLWVNLFCKIPVFFSVMHDFKTFAALPRKILTALLGKKNMIFAGVSNAVRNDIQKSLWFISKNRIITLYNKIDINQTQEKLLNGESARSFLNLKNDVFLFGNIGRLVKQKDQATLIKAFAKIKPDCPKAKLVILGVGKLENELKHLAQQLNVNNDVIFTGFVPDAFRYMKAFDVFTLTSTHEAFGRVLLEAMVAKIPIIATNVYGIPEVIGETGPLIPAANSETLSEEMLKAYRASVVQLTEWGIRGFDRAVNQFSFELFNKKFWQLPVIRELLK